MVFPLTADTLEYGFVIDGFGAHSSRTIMLHELTLLLAACPMAYGLADYARAILDNNVLLKKTDVTRRESVRRLRALYSLDRKHVLFRALRDLWSFDQDAQPMLALLCAMARDPILRATAPVVLAARPGDVVAAGMLSAAVNQRYPGRLNQTTLATIGRNAASSWTQSSHLQGRTYKIRRAASSCLASVAYALFLGYLCGQRGEALFQTDWVKLLDTPLDLLHDRAFRAAQQGWLEYRHTGAVTEIGFTYLLRPEAGGESA